jgi:hypothetical protein
MLMISPEMTGSRAITSKLSSGSLKEDIAREDAAARGTEEIVRSIMLSE